jgi:hypothetical protein
MSSIDYLDLSATMLESITSARFFVRDFGRGFGLGFDLGEASESLKTTDFDCLPRAGEGTSTTTDLKGVDVAGFVDDVSAVFIDTVLDFGFSVFTEADLGLRRGCFCVSDCGSGEDSKVTALTKGLLFFGVLGAFPLGGVVFDGARGFLRELGGGSTGAGGSSCTGSTSISSPVVTGTLDGSSSSALDLDFLLVLGFFVGLLRDVWGSSECDVGRETTDCFSSSSSLSESTGARARFRVERAERGGALHRIFRQETSLSS